MTYRISLRSSSVREPRYPGHRVVLYVKNDSADYHENDRQSQASENAIIGYRMFDIP